MVPLHTLPVIAPLTAERGPAASFLNVVFDSINFFVVFLMAFLLATPRARDMPSTNCCESEAADGRACGSRHATSADRARLAWPRFTLPSVHTVQMTQQ